MNECIHGTPYEQECLLCVKEHEEKLDAAKAAGRKELANEIKVVLDSAPTQVFVHASSFLDELRKIISR